MDVEIEAFRLTAAQKADIRDDLSRKIRAGLATPLQEIKALPAYIPVPSGAPTGNAVILDVGGTNIRAAYVSLQPEGAKIIGEPAVNSEIMSLAKDPGEVTAEEFFDAQAELVEQVCPEKTVAIGYCFSYPTETQTDADAKLIRWTKGIHIPGVEGASVRNPLLKALAKRGIQVANRVPVPNDTVSSLLAGVALDGTQTHYIGLIVGTGTNIAGFFPVRSITKLTERWDGGEKMAVNLESGNFHPPHLTKYDDALDGTLDNPNAQRFEKAVSGMYLPPLFGTVVGRETCIAECGFDPFDPDDSKVNTSHVADQRERGDWIGEVATAILDRSADLAAAALAGLIAVYEEEPSQNGRRVAVLAEGSTFWKTDGYRERVEASLKELVRSDTKVTILDPPAIDANALGTACAALTS